MFNQEAEQLLDQFLAMESHEEAMAELDEFCAKHHPRRNFASAFGLLLEWFGYEEAKKMFGVDVEITNPSQNKNLYKLYFPGILDDLVALNGGIPGITTADGFGVKLGYLETTHCISHVFEYKGEVFPHQKTWIQLNSLLYRSGFKKDFKATSNSGELLLGRRLNQVAPNIPAKPTYFGKYFLDYFVTEDCWINNPEQFNLEAGLKILKLGTQTQSNFGQIRVHALPFTSTTFRSFTQLLLSELQAIDLEGARPEIIA